MLKSVCYLIANQIIRKAPLLLLPILLAMAWNGALLAQGNNCPGCSEPAKVVHPNGFGPHSYARWKPKVGEPDSSGTNNFAMLLVHLTPPDVTTAARAVVAVEGFDGDNPVGYTLAFDHRATGENCTPGGQFGNPRWSVRYRVLDTNGNTLIDTHKYYGCADALPTSSLSGDPNWVRKTFTVTPLDIPANAIIVSLAILFDAPPGTLLNPTGSVRVDNISVTPPGGPTFTWTCPADNGAN